MQHAAPVAGAEWGDLLIAVAEQLKVPLTLISRQAELSELIGDAGVDASLMHTQADAALQLVDSYLLGLELLRGQTSLELEPVSVSSTLADTAHALTRFAKQYDVAVNVVVGGKYEPVMAHGRGLRAALLSLGFGMIEALAAVEGSELRTLELVSHKTPQGIITGMYGASDNLQVGQWRTALQLMGRAQQPFTGLSAGTGAGLFVADTIFKGMASQLRVGSWQRQRGLAATLRPSRQLQLI